VEKRRERRGGGQGKRVVSHGLRTLPIGNKMRHQNRLTEKSWKKEAAKTILKTNPGQPKQHNKIYVREKRDTLFIKKSYGGGTKRSEPLRGKNL